MGNYLIYVYYEPKLNKLDGDLLPEKATRLHW